MRVIEALDDPDMDLGRMSAMVSAEPLLAARTVALANSAWYNPGGRVVTDVPKALVRIGFGKLRALAMAVAAEQLIHRDVLSPFQPLIRRLWAHCVDVAATAFVLARRCTKLDRDAAFFAGMVTTSGSSSCWPGCGNTRRCSARRALFRTWCGFGMPLWGGRYWRP